MASIMGIFWPIQWLLGWIVSIFHSLLVTCGFPDGASGAWPFAIILMTFFIKLCMIPILIKQIGGMRRMQAVAPMIKEIQKKYKGKTDTTSKQALSAETMALYKKHNANPMSSCLPSLLQAPILFSLYGMLSAVKNIAAGTADAIGPINAKIADEIQNSYFFAAKLSDYFATDNMPAKITIIITIAIMSVSMFLSQNFTQRYNTPTATQADSQVKMQRTMTYAFPLIYIFTGTNVPMGVLVYWIVSNLWMLGQSLFTLYFVPTPGSRAWDAKEERDKKKNIKMGIVPEEPPIIESKQRTQPKAKKRSKK